VWKITKWQISEYANPHWCFESYLHLICIKDPVFNQLWSDMMTFQRLLQCFFAGATSDIVLLYVHWINICFICNSAYLFTEWCVIVDILTLFKIWIEILLWSHALDQIFNCHTWDWIIINTLCTWHNSKIPYYMSNPSYMVIDTFYFNQIE
jgi:hypothetical protein